MSILAEARNRLAKAYVVRPSVRLRGRGHFSGRQLLEPSHFFLNAVENPFGIHLSGHAGSLAASLDNALSKQPIWLAEMFVIDTLGNCLARRFIYRTNSERKRPGPVSLSLNQNYLQSTMIEVVADGRQVLDVLEIAALRTAILAVVDEARVDVPLAA